MPPFIWPALTRRQQNSSTQLIDQLIDLPEASLACQEPQLDIILNA